MGYGAFNMAAQTPHIVVGCGRTRTRVAGHTVDAAKYSAEAIVYPNLFSREQGRPVTLASIDAASLVNGEARLIRSDAILRAVAKRLGEDPEATKPRSWARRSLDWVRSMFDPRPATIRPSIARSRSCAAKWGS